MGNKTRKQADKPEPSFQAISRGKVTQRQRTVIPDTEAVAGKAFEFTTLPIQPKLAINQPNDRYEQEADRVAERVMNSGVRGQAKPVSEQITPLVQREAAGPEKDEEEKVQAKSQPGSAQEASPSAESAVQASRCGGQPLPENVRSYFEPRFGHNFSNVRVHDDAEGAASARSVNAQAFTLGRDIVFGAGQYAPGSPSGRRLLAHELTHVVQQAAAPGSGRPGPATVQRQSTFPSAGPKVLEEDTKKSEPITRTEQAKHQYGLECLGDSVMYMIQSYGFVPPDMSRQEFEHAFTPLNPPGFSKTDKIKVGGKEQKGAAPVDLFSKALEGTAHPAKVSTSIGNVTKTEATLRGADSGGLSAQDVVKKLPDVFSAFKAQSQKPGYEFMQAHRPSLEAFKPEVKEEWVTTNDLENNTIGDDYFQKGNTVLVELCLVYPATPSVGHRCVVVGKAKYTIKDTAGQNHYLYPADDPWYGSTLVMVPPDTDGWAEKDAKAGVSVDDRSAGLLKYNGQIVLQVAKGNNHIYRRKMSSP